MWKWTCSAGERMDGVEKRSAQLAPEDMRTRKAAPYSSESKWNRYQDEQLSSWVGC